MTRSQLAPPTSLRLYAFPHIGRKLVSELTSEMHQGFEQVNRELGENRERMAKLEGSLDGFLAGRRDRDAA